jgi:hypothetical protein
MTIAAGIGAAIGAVSGVVALLQDSEYLGRGLLLIGAALALLLLWSYLRQFGHKKVSLPIWAIALSLALIVGILSLLGFTLLRNDRPSTNNSPAATITKPKNGQKIDPTSGLSLAGTLTGVDADYCRTHHIWFVGRAPIGRNGQPLHSARRELPCKNGPWSFRDEITPRDWHDFAVRAVSDDRGQQYMRNNERFTKLGDPSRDGEWVDLPPGTDLLSNIVRIPT